MESANSELKATLPDIRNYVIKKLNENGERSLYNNSGRLYRLEKNMELIAKEEQVSEDVQSRLSLLMYVKKVLMKIENLEQEINFCWR